jgi:general secretion pathway protein G
MKTAHRSPRHARGFTLLEIVIVIALIGLILGVVANRIMGNKVRAEYKLTETQLAGLATKVETYEADTGALPSSLEQLVTAPSDAQGWLGPYAQPTELKDPWQTPIQLRVPGENGARFQVVSLGADRVAGGEGTDKDIVKP